MAKIRESLSEFARRGLLAPGAAEAALARIRSTTRLDDAASAQLVIEAVPEDLPLKHAIFERLDRLCPPPAVLASSSGQPISRLIDRVRHRGRAVAAHFWNPPQLIPLVEVCAGPETEPGVVALGVRRAPERRQAARRPGPGDRRVHRQPAPVRPPARGARAVGGRGGLGGSDRPRGQDELRAPAGGDRPPRSADLGGLDTFHAFCALLFPGLDASGAPPAAMAQLVRDGHRGFASGRGIYDWRDGTGERWCACARRRCSVSSSGAPERVRARRGRWARGGTPRASP